jgi:hypothetical protein
MIIYLCIAYALFIADAAVMIDRGERFQLLKSLACCLLWPVTGAFVVYCALRIGEDLTGGKK